MDQNEIISRAKKYIAEETDARFRNEVETLLEKKDFAELEDRFYQSLEFGTGGLRGIMGGGTNRMNTLMINKATQGLANYVKKAFPQKAATGTLSAVIACDSRKNSDVFAEAAALIFVANGITCFLFSSLRPTPELSFAIRTLKTDTGVVVTASHNPRQYNGYKAYWNDGAQVIPPHDAGIIDEVNAVETVKTISKDDALKNGKLKIIDKEIDEAFWKMCSSQLFRPSLIKEKAASVKIVYTPLHGTGAMHVEKVLGDLGLNVITVPEQKAPDGNFPTVEKPNPEEKAALALALALGKKEKADCVMATDPDADRFGSAFPDNGGNFVLITGNQMGALLLDYIVTSRNELGTMPEKPFVVRTIVTSPFVDAICKKHKIKLIECLTGFKWIAAVQAKMEAEKAGEYIFGFEESYGYKIEKEVFDKDGISASAMCAEMTLYWQSKGKSLLEHLNEMYREYGFFEDKTIEKYFPGSSGKETMDAIMQKLRNDGLQSLAGSAVEKIVDIQKGVSFSPANPSATNKIDLPKSNVLQFYLANGTKVSARPSGTEPKIKFYINTALDVKEKTDATLQEAQKVSHNIIADIEKEIMETLKA